MRIFISNHCEYVAVISIDSGKYIDIQPYQTISVECAEGLKTGISVRSNMLSAKKKRYYALELETCYIIVNAKRDEVFYITSEKNLVEYNAYYERLILNSDSSACIPQSYKVLGEKIIKNTLKKARVREILLFNNLESLSSLHILLVVVGIILSNKFGWRFAFIYFPSIYVINTVIFFFIDVVCNELFKKMFGGDYTTKGYYRLCDSDYIKKYYSKSEAPPLWDK